jgi:hypothetical protein
MAGARFHPVPGRRIIGLTPDPVALRARRRRSLDVETGLLDRRQFR